MGHVAQRPCSSYLHKCVQKQSVSTHIPIIYESLKKFIYGFYNYF